MATETTEAPPAVIAPEVQEKSGMGPMPVVTKFGDKFRAEMAKVDATIKPTEPPPEPTLPEPPSKEAEPVNKDAESLKKPTDAVDSPPSKPESPLDVVIEKAPKEEKPEATDILADADAAISDLSKIAVPKSEHWAKARDTMDKLRLELKAAKTTPKTQEPVQDTATVKRIEELQAEIADRDNRIKAINAEYSPEYQKLVGKWQGTAEKIKTRMQSFGADGDSLLAALSLPYSKIRTYQIDTALGELDAGKQGRIQSLIEELEGHGEEIAEFRKDLPKRGEELIAAQQAQATEQRQQAIKQAEISYLGSAEKLSDKYVTLREVSDDVPGGTEWNNDIRESRTEGLRLLMPDGATQEESEEAAALWKQYPKLEKRYLSLYKDHKELKKAYAALDSSGPDFKGTSKPTSKTEKSRGVKYHEALAQRQAAGDQS